MCAADVSVCARWDGKPIPLPCCDKQGYTLCGDWSLPGPKEDAQAWFAAYIPKRVASLGVPITTNALLMMDWESLATGPHMAYPTMLHIARKILPNATIGVWLAGPNDQLLTEAMRDELRRGRAALMPEVYQHTPQSPAEAQIDAATAVRLCAAACPGVPIIPCLCLGLGWAHPRYPKTAGADGTGPLATAANLIARRVAISALIADCGIPSVAWWESARVGDDQRVAALTLLGARLRPRVEALRGDEALEPNA